MGPSTPRDQGGAEAVLGRALQLAAPEGFVRLFLDEGAALAPLLHQTRTAALRFW